MDNKDERRRWGTDQRLEFIEFRLYWDGSINRSDITAQFGVSVPQASNDLSLYKELAGDNLRYDSSSKRYEAAPGFKPRLTKPSAERYLAQLKAIADRVIEPSDTPIADAPDLGVMPVPQRRVDPEVLRSLVQAVRRRRSIAIEYQSLNDARPEPIWREITPHAFGHDGLRWHVRAYCHLESTYKDFIISRCLAVGAMGEPKGLADADTNWTTLFDVVLKPNPKLSPAQRRVIELDYGMKDGKAVVSVRLALLYYFDKRLRLDIAESKDRPRETPVVIQNRKDYDAALARVAY